MVLSTRRGLSLVEVMIAGSIATAVLAILQVVFSGAFRALSWESLHDTAQTEFLALKEYFSRDVEHASSVIKEIQLEGTLYQTETDSATLEDFTANALVLRLPAIDAKGDIVPGVYDFVSYTLEECHGDGVCLRRRLFTTRAASGDPLISAQKSARGPDDRIVLRHVLKPDLHGQLDIPPLFQFDPPSVSIAREVTLSIASQTTGSPSRPGGIPTSYTATFRLRNK